MFLQHCVKYKYDKLYLMKTKLVELAKSYKLTFFNVNQSENF